MTHGEIVERVLGLYGDDMRNQIGHILGYYSGQPGEAQDALVLLYQSHVQARLTAANFPHDYVRHLVGIIFPGSPNTRRAP